MRRLALCAPLIAAVLSMAGPGVAFGARVRVTGHRPLVAPAGGRLAVTLTVHGKATLRLKLALPKTRITLRGKGRRVRAGRHRVRLLATVPRSVPRGTPATLLACAGKRCTRVVKLRTSGPDLADRIAAAIAAHRLSHTRALVYGLWALAK